MNWTMAIVVVWYALTTGAPDIIFQEQYVLSRIEW